MVSFVCLQYFIQTLTWQFISLTISKLITYEVFENSDQKQPNHVSWLMFLVCIDAFNKNKAKTVAASVVKLLDESICLPGSKVRIKQEAYSLIYLSFCKCLQ